MKKLLFTTVLLAMFTAFTTTNGQVQREEFLGLPGDNLNLYAVMKIFQESKTLEDFERNLNDKNTMVNNLDLNGDNYVDYIQVMDYPDGNVHNIVLQVAINEREAQNVAVFNVQRFNNNQVQIQLIGDEELYGKNYIIEPYYDSQTAGQTPNPGYAGTYSAVRTTTFEISYWPLIRFIYLPTYYPWRSLWSWGYYPSYWNPWRPYYWDYYYGYHYHWYNTYYSCYRRWDYPRYAHWNDFYYSGNRAHSQYVSSRIKTGYYKTTYSRPDQRKKGEAHYARVNSNNNRRTAVTQASSTTRRTGNQVSQNRQSAVTSSGNARRATAAVNKTKPVYVTTSQGTASTRKTGTTVKTRTSASTSTANIPGKARKTTNTVSRATPGQVSRQTSSQARKPSTAGTSRPASNTKQVQSAARSRTTGNMATSRASAPASRSGGQSKAATPARSSEKRNTTAPSNNSRRK